MADGEINRNDATIRIDDNGGIQVEPADGQEVEYTGPDRGTEAIRDSVNTEEATIGVLEFADSAPILASNAFSTDSGTRIYPDNPSDEQVILVLPAKEFVESAFIRYDKNGLSKTSLDSDSIETLGLNGSGNHTFEIDSDNYITIRAVDGPNREFSFLSFRFFGTE